MLTKLVAQVLITAELTYEDCLVGEWNKNILLNFLTGSPTTTGLPSCLYSKNLNYKEEIQLHVIDTKGYISKTVWDSKVNILDVLNYEFPTKTVQAGHSVVCSKVG